MKVEKSTSAGYAVALFLRTNKSWSDDQENFGIEKKIFDTIEYGEYLHTVVERISGLTTKIAQQWAIGSKRHLFASSLKIAIYDGGYNDNYRIFYWAKYHALLIPSGWTRWDWGFYYYLTKAFVQIIEESPRDSGEIKLNCRVEVKELLLKSASALESSIPPLEWYHLAVKADLEDGQGNDFLTGLILNKVEENPRYCDEDEDENEDEDEDE